MLRSFGRGLSLYSFASPEVLEASIQINNEDLSKGRFYSLIPGYETKFYSVSIFRGFTVHRVTITENHLWLAGCFVYITTGGAGDQDRKYTHKVNRKKKDDYQSKNQYNSKYTEVADRNV